MQIHPIDLRHQGQPGVIAAFLVQGATGLALVESGPESTLPALLDGIRALGFSPGDIRHVLVTHIHLDHAGAAGWWARRGARVYVHARGAAHLIDPSKLLASAEMVYGDRMVPLWGGMTPAPAENVQPIAGDRAFLHVGDLAFTAWDTPGHARHHLAFEIEGNVFAGDVCGARFAGCPYTSVTSAPPQFDPAAYDRSLALLADLSPQRLYLTHFGAIDDPADHIARYRAAVADAAAFVHPLVAAGADDAEIRARYTEKCRAEALGSGCSEAEWQRYEAANPSGMCADGIALWRARRADR